MSGFASAARAGLRQTGSWGVRQRGTGRSDDLRFPISHIRHYAYQTRVIRLWWELWSAPAPKAWCDMASSRSGAAAGDQPISEIHFLTVAEVAAVMRVSKMTVYRLVHSGEMPAARVGRSFRVPETAVERLSARVLLPGRLSGRDAPPPATPDGDPEGAGTDPRPVTLGLLSGLAPGCLLLRRRPPHNTAPSKGSRGFRHQEAPKADGQEEAPQAVEEDAHPASRQEVARHARIGSPWGASSATPLWRNQWAASSSSPGSPVTSAARLAACWPPSPSIERVIGVDVVPPQRGPRPRPSSCGRTSATRDRQGHRCEARSTPSCT